MPARFYWIDVLRGVAAMAVVLFHYHHFYLADWADRPVLVGPEGYPLHAVLWPVYEHGDIAVPLFWLISGFVFLHVYHGRRATLWAYAVARFARLYPLHLATLLFMAALQAASLYWVGHWQIYSNNDVQHFVLNLGFASAWGPLSHGLSFNGPIWSVSAEILVYVVFFASLPAIRRHGIGVAAALLALSAAMVGYDGLRPPRLSAVVPFCAAYFYAGCILCRAVAVLHARPNRVIRLAAACAVTAAVLGWFKLGGWAMGAAFAAVVAMLAALDLRRGALGPRLGGWGDVSYSLYLVHVPFQAAVLLYADLVLGGSRAFAASGIFAASYVGCVTALAWAAYRWFERPAGLAIRSRAMRGGRPPGPTGPLRDLGPPAP